MIFEDLAIRAGITSPYFICIYSKELQKSIIKEYLSRHEITVMLFVSIDFPNCKISEKLYWRVFSSRQ
jgi:hypothetical protein